jgi:hypothetical protein
MASAKYSTGDNMTYNRSFMSGMMIKWQFPDRKNYKQKKHYLCHHGLGNRVTGLSLRAGTGYLRSSQEPPNLDMNMEYQQCY